MYLQILKYNILQSSQFHCEYLILIISMISGQLQLVTEGYTRNNTNTKSNNNNYDLTSLASSSLLHSEAMDLCMASYSSLCLFRTGALDSTSRTTSSRTRRTRLDSCFSSWSWVWADANALYSWGEIHLVIDL